MFLVGIDIGKNSHFFSVLDNQSGEMLIKPISFKNNLDGFNFLLHHLKSYSKKDVLIGMEDTGHYHSNLLTFLLKKDFKVALINPRTTDLQRKQSGSVTKDDKLDTHTICDVLDNPERKKLYRIVTLNKLEYHEQRQLTRHHHDLTESLNIICNKLQKSIDIVFPEYNSLFKSKYSTVYIDVLKTFGSAKAIANADIRSIRKCFEIKGQGRRISLTPEELKKAAKNSIGFSTLADEFCVKNAIAQFELLTHQIEEVDKKIEEFSTMNNSPILSIPGISHFSGTSILSELGAICNYSKHSQIIKFAGLAPYKHESSQYTAQHLGISKKGSKYLRKTLYQIITPVINNNMVFKDYYNLKRSQGKSHRCAQGHCVRKLLRIIYHLLSTNQTFNPHLLK